jgi:hypothetical protein
MFDTYPSATGEVKQRPSSPLEVAGIAGGEPIDVELSAAPVLTVTLTSDVASFGFTPSAGAANVCEVLITPKDLLGATKAGVNVYDVWLSDAATGIGLTGTTASGTVTAKAASGSVWQTFTAKKHLQVQTLATGLFTLEITDTAKTGFFVVARLPSGLLSVSAQLVTANYGA